MFFHDYGNTQYFKPGYIGDFLYYSSDTESPQYLQHPIYANSADILRSYDALKASYAQYSTEKINYDARKEEYNGQVRRAKNRQLDWFERVFTRVIPIPERPCKPLAPVPWWGPNFLPT